MDMTGTLSIHRLVPSNAPQYRALMLEAYENHPDAFTSSVGERASLPLSWWESRVAPADRAAEIVFGAFGDATLIGVAGLSFETRQKVRHKAKLCLRRCFALVFVALGFAPSAVMAAGVSSDHPLLGTWTFTVPGTACAETYRFRADGTTFVTSGQEVSESAYKIAAKPSAKGFYRWNDTVIKDNGKPDCGGRTMTIGSEATNFVRFHPSGELMIVCRDESLDACFGPLRRVHGQET